MSLHSCQDNLRILAVRLLGSVNLNLVVQQNAHSQNKLVKALAHWADSRPTIVCQFVTWDPLSAMTSDLTHEWLFNVFLFFHQQKQQCSK